MKAVGIRRALNASLGMTENKLTVIKIEIILTFSDRGPRLFQEDGKDEPLALFPPPPPGRAHLEDLLRGLSFICHSGCRMRLIIGVPVPFPATALQLCGAQKKALLLTPPHLADLHSFHNKVVNKHSAHLGA